MAASADEVEALVKEYKSARAEIDRFGGSEREVGLAALRLEVTSTYRQVATTGATPDTVLGPLRDFASNLVGGESAERAVAYFDEKATAAAASILSSITSSLVGGVLAGSAATVVAVAALVAGFFDQLGQAAFATLIAGGSAAFALIRGTYVSGQAAGSAADQGWAWASSLGTRSDKALRTARQHRQTVWGGAGGGMNIGQPFTAIARDRAMLMVGAAIVLGVVAVVLVGMGVLNGYEAWSDTIVQVP